MTPEDIQEAKGKDPWGSASVFTFICLTGPLLLLRLLLLTMVQFSSVQFSSFQLLSRVRLFVTP